MATNQDSKTKIKPKNNASLSLQISTAKDRWSKSWRNQDVSWAGLINKVAETHRTHETVAEYVAMKKDQQDTIKDIGGFVGGHLKDGRRRNGNVVSRQIVSLDADYAYKDFWEDVEINADYAMVCYSTHKHTTAKPRLRLVIPLLKPVTPEQYEAIARKLASAYGMDYFDDTTYQPTRLMYWPSTSKDGDYFFKFIDAPVLDPDKVLAQYTDWKDTSYWPFSDRAIKTRKRNADKQGDPLEKTGLIGAFCRTYSIQDAIDTFLSDIYSPTDQADRFTYIHGSTSGGLVVYDNKFAYSNHATDPISGQLCNSFDLVRIHKFGIDDLESKEDTPINRLPSWSKMMDLVNNDELTSQTIGMEHLRSAKEEFEVEDPDEADDGPDVGPDDAEGDDAKAKKPKKKKTDRYKWMTKLTKNGQGQYETTIDNYLLILENDDNLKGLGKHNLFNDRIEILRKLPWPRSGDYWTDIDDAGIRHYMESVYQIEGRQKLVDALTLTFERSAYHPVKQFLTNTMWDGKPRLETLLVDYLGAEDCEYVRVLTRKALVAAVTRIFRPGCKFDYMLTIRGDQGIGKSLLISRLGKGWSSDSLPDINGKEAYEALDGVWLMEIPELSAFRHQDRESIKKYISKQEDTYRKAYARNVTVNKRQCIFIGTTNNTEFLDDATGGRRFWIIETKVERRTKTVWDDLNDEEVDQIWAEAYEGYLAGENIMSLPEKVAARALKEQEQHSDFNTYIGTITEFLRRKIPPDFSEYTISQRQQWAHASDEYIEEHTVKGMRLRNEVCAAEIWVEAFEKDLASLTKATARTINECLERVPGWTKNEHPKRYGVYGTQRGFTRDDMPF